MPEDVANEAQTSPSLHAAASDPQAATYLSDSEYPTKPDPSFPTSRAYPYPQVSSLMSPSTGYAAGTTYSTTYTGTMETMMPNYPSVISPSYTSPYGTKQFSWPNLSSGYSPELMQTAAYMYQPATAQMAMSRPNYPTAGYFLPPVATTTSQSC